MEIEISLEDVHFSSYYGPNTRKERGFFLFSGKAVFAGQEYKFSLFLSPQPPFEASLNKSVMPWLDYLPAKEEVKKVIIEYCQQFLKERIGGFWDDLEKLDEAKKQAQILTVSLLENEGKS